MLKLCYYFVLFSSWQFDFGEEGGKRILAKVMEIDSTQAQELQDLRYCS
jgi:hypothetical protein